MPGIKTHLDKCRQRSPDESREVEGAGTIYKQKPNPKQIVKHEKKTNKKQADVVEIEDEEYEYYSTSSEAEPPTKKAKKDCRKATSSKEVLDLEGWKRRAQELERIANKLTKENKALRKRAHSLKEKKSRKGQEWKKTMKSLLEAGGDTTSTEPES